MGWTAKSRRKTLSGIIALCLVLSWFGILAPAISAAQFEFVIEDEQPVEDGTPVGGEPVPVISEEGRITYGFLPSLAFDSNGALHISYYDGGSLAHAVNTGSGWTTEIVHSWPHRGQYSSIFLDSNDHIHISYVDFYTGGPGDEQLMYAFWDGSSWTIEPVDSITSYICDTSIAVSSNNEVWIVYYSSGSDTGLKYAVKSRGSWNIGVVDPGGYGGASCSIVMDSQDNPQVSYCDADQKLKYARWNGTSWDTEVVDSCGSTSWGYGVSMKLGPNDDPRIAYKHSSGELRYAEWNGSSWSIETVDTEAVYALSLDLDSDHNPHIGYGLGYGGAVKHAVREDGAWQIETVSTDMGDTGISLAVFGNFVVLVYESNINNGDLFIKTITL